MTNQQLVVTKKAYAVLKDGQLYPCGVQCRYPIFELRKDAEAWRAEIRCERSSRIVRVTIEIEDKQ